MLSEQNCEISRQNGVTKFMTVLAALCCVLGAIHGEEDIVVGSPIAGRNRQEIEGLIGFFLNTLVLRGGIYSGNPSFSELLRRVREVALEALCTSGVAVLKSSLKKTGTAAESEHSPLFQVMFSLNRAAQTILVCTG